MCKEPSSFWNVLSAQLNRKYYHHPSCTEFSFRGHRTPAFPHGIHTHTPLHVCGQHYLKACQAGSHGIGAEKSDQPQPPLLGHSKLIFMSENTTPLSKDRLP